MAARIMASEVQIAANRRNAEKSTGPKTEEGKAVAARNSLRHGMRARQIVCFDERQADFESFYTALEAALDPADAVEEQLVERIALCSWRLRRAARVEAELINSAFATQPNRPLTKVATVFDVSPDDMTTLSRYEMALDNAVKRGMALLERRQARRRGENVLAPIEVSIDGLDALDGDAIRRATNPEFRQTNPILPEESAAGNLPAGG